MIQWHKGEPPKDGEWHVAAIRSGESKTYVDLINFCEYADQWHAGENYLSDDAVVIAWSESNLPEDHP